jgi:hypothetical protein
MKRLGVILLLVLASWTGSSDRRDVASGAERSPEATATVPNVCVLWMQVQDGTQLDPPIYYPRDAKCSGACATSNCRLTTVGSSTTGQTVVTTVECLCASGGGAQACRAREERTSTDGGLTISSRKMVCVGTCPTDNDEETPVLACDFFFDGSVPPDEPAGSQWIRCVCQAGTPGD